MAEGIDGENTPPPTGASAVDPARIGREGEGAAMSADDPTPAKGAGVPKSPSRDTVCG
jgi:hypothetical protein